MDTGYTYLMNLKNKELSQLLGITLQKAHEIKTMTFQELCRCEDICIEEKNILDIKAKCREKAYGCANCRKEFLEHEIPEI